MHENEFPIDAALARRLIDDQFPQWRELPLVRIASTGTVNAIFRLGDDMAVRLPLQERVPGQVEKEVEWVPKLAPFLPLAVPQQLGLGEPTEDYPGYWNVSEWLPGENPTLDTLNDKHQAAEELGEFLAVMHRIDTVGGPRPGRNNFYRGTPLSWRDEYVRTAIAQCEGLIDTKTVTQMWDEAVAIPEWDQPPVWIHGDIHGANLLANEGQLTAVIDWGGMAVGDPACDMIPAWCFLDADTRDTFRRVTGIVDDTWLRGRGWALSVGLLQLPYYRDTNPYMVEMAHQGINELLAEFGRD